MNEYSFSQACRLFSATYNLIRAGSSLLLQWESRLREVK
jgi:hypothetical protein